MASKNNALGPDYVTFDSSMLDAGGAGLQIFASVIFFSPALFIASACLGPWAGAAVLAVAALPKLLWQPSSAAEGRAFTLSNYIYWNLVYPCLFGSPLLVGACCALRPRSCLPLLGAWLLWTRVLSRPDLGPGAPWAHFAKHDWGIVALRRFLRLRLHVSKALRALDPAIGPPVVLGIHPHGVASDYRVAMDGMLYEALPGRPLFTLAASVLFALPLVGKLPQIQAATEPDCFMARRGGARSFSLCS